MGEAQRPPVGRLRSVTLSLRRGVGPDQPVWRVVGRGEDPRALDALPKAR